MPTALHDQGFYRMFREGRIAAVLEAGGKAAREPNSTVGGARQQGAASDVVRPPSNAATTAWPSTRAKSNSVGLNSVGITLPRDG